MRAIKVYCPPGVEPPLYAFIDALDGKLKAKDACQNTLTLSATGITELILHCKFHGIRDALEIFYL